MLEDLRVYGPIALALVTVSILVAKYPGYVGLPKERVRSTLLIFIGAGVLFVALDLVSGRALTAMSDIPRATVVFLIAVAVLAAANVIYLLVQGRRAPR